jgi:hypothetical protein
VSFDVLKGVKMSVFSFSSSEHGGSMFLLNATSPQGVTAEKTNIDSEMTSI